MSAKLEDAKTQVRDLEKKYEDILLKVDDYENRIRTLCTEVQEAQKEVNRLTDDVSKKVRLSLEQYHKLKISLSVSRMKRKYYCTTSENKRLWNIKCATRSLSFFHFLVPFFLPLQPFFLLFSSFSLCKTFCWFF
jgi:chromosome segregation ATPase